MVFPAKVIAGTMGNESYFGVSIHERTFATSTHAVIPRYKSG